MSPAPAGKGRTAAQAKGTAGAKARSCEPGSLFLEGQVCGGGAWRLRGLGSWEGVSCPGLGPGPRCAPGSASTLLAAAAQEAGLSLLKILFIVPF